ncbi:MAG TPA: VWA domain-containing protein [Urbifossiella sp.]|nr:VWA domain-containing protein [Urbifossiella sp.]
MSSFMRMPLRAHCGRKLSILLLGGLCLALTACGAGVKHAAGGKRAARELAPAEANQANSETYTHTVDNPFRSVADAPLSTFSADVNTASYSNVRRFLIEQNQLPVKDAVFLAELVNYFPFSYARPRGADPIAFNLELGQCPWNRAHHLLRIGVQARELDAEQMPPRNLVFLIDTSGSMQASNRLPLVQKSLTLLVERLSEKDTVSIVTYAGVSRVALNPTRGADKRRIQRAIDSLSADGSTNGEGGIRVAYDLAAQTFIDGGVNRVILCTDGDFNVGVTNPGDLIRLIEQKRRSRVFLTVLGFGMGNYKDATLKEIANHGNGHHAYIDSIEEARKVFVEQGGALACVAKDVKFQVEFNPKKVIAYRLLGYENRLLKDEDFKDDAKDAADLGSGHQVTVLYEIVPIGVAIDLPGVDPLKYQQAKEPAAGGSDEWLTVKMRYKHPEEEKSLELVKPLMGNVKARELSDDFRFAAAVASFGMLLRESPYKGSSNYDDVIRDSSAALGSDPQGHRKQFVELVRKARQLAGAQPRLERDQN